MKLTRIIGKYVLLIIPLLLLTCNLSTFLTSVDAQEPQFFKGQQLTLTPIGKGAYTQLFGVESITGPYFPENWQYAESADSKVLRARSQKATDTYELSDHEPSKNFGSIYSIDIVITYESIGQRQGIAGAIYLNGTLYDAEKQEITGITEGDMYFRITINPITTKPWTWSDIDNLEAGATLFASSLTSSSPNLDQVYVIVNYGMDITVITNPPNCNVTLNNITINSSTNGATFTGLTPYTIWNITISKTYFYSKSMEVILNDSSVQQNISLLPSHYKLSVNSNPEGCKVLIDGFEKTPVMVPINSSHTITVSKDSFYYTKQETVTVGSENLTVQINLASSPIPYIIFIITVIILVIIAYLLYKLKRKLDAKRQLRMEEERKKQELKKQQVNSVIEEIKGKGAWDLFYLNTPQLAAVGMEQLEILYVPILRNTERQRKKRVTNK